MATQAASIGGQRATVVELAVAAIVILVLQGIGVGAQTGEEPQLENGQQVETQLARAIDLVAREIAAVEIELAVVTLEVVPGIGVASATVPDTVAAVRVRTAVEALRV